MKTIQECQEALTALDAAEENFLHSLGFKEFQYFIHNLAVEEFKYTPISIDMWEPPDVVCGVGGAGALTRKQAIEEAYQLLQTRLASNEGK